MNRKYHYDESRLIRSGSGFFQTALIIAVLLLIGSSASAASVKAWGPEELIRNYIKTHYPWEEIEISGLRVKSGVPGRAPETIIMERGPIGSVVFRFIYGDKTKVLARAHVRAFGQVIKSIRPFTRGHVINKSDIYVARMDIRKMPKGSIKAPGAVVGKALKRSITANIPVVESMIERSEIVKRGRRVVLWISRNGMNIRTAGKTKEKGYVGMPVSAMNLTTRKIVRGVLVDESTVKVGL